MKKYLLVLTILSLMALWPFFRKGYFESHDGHWWVIRFSAFHQALTQGQIPVRYVERLNNNYGYPVFNFTYPLPYYLAEIPKVLGLGFVDSIKAVFIGSTILSTLLMYWALLAKFPKHISFLAAIIYLFVPYRFVDLYVRGSIGETLLFTFAPLVLGSIFRLSGKFDLNFLLLALSISGLILSHNILAIVFLIIFILTGVVYLKKSQFTFFFLAIFLAIFLTSFFIIPALFYLQDESVSIIKIDYSTHLTPLSRLVFSPWGYEALPNSINGFSTQIGVIPFVVILVSLIHYFRKIENSALFKTYILIFLGAVFLMTNLSYPVWNSIKVLHSFQHPWRLLSVVAFVTPLLLAICLSHIKLKSLKVYLLAALIVLSTIIYTRPKNFNNYPDAFYSTNEATTAIWNEFLPKWASKTPLARNNSKLGNNLQIIVKEKRENYLSYQYQLNALEDTDLIINTIYFPGFTSSIDGHKVTTSYDENGLISLKLPKGEHKVIIKYGKTPVHLFSELISLISLTGTGIYFLYLWRKQNS